jgi:hypothetical protein
VSSSFDFEIENFLKKHFFCSIFRVFGRPLKVRLGEWDASSLNQVITPQEYQVARIFIHPQYTVTNLRNSIAILRLSTPVTLGTTPSITPVSCSFEDFLTNCDFCHFLGMSSNKLSQWH